MLVGMTSLANSFIYLGRLKEGDYPPGSASHAARFCVFRRAKQALYKGPGQAQKINIFHLRTHRPVELVENHRKILPPGTIIPALFGEILPRTFDGTVPIVGKMGENPVDTDFYPPLEDTSMKYAWIPALAVALSLALAGCSQESDTTAGTDAAAPEQSMADKAKAALASAKEKTQAAYASAKEKSAAAYEAAKEKSKAAYEAAKEKGPEYYEQAKAKSAQYYEDAKAKSMEAYADLKENAPEMYEQAKAKTQEAYEKAKAKTQEMYHQAGDKMAEMTHKGDAAADAAQAGTDTVVTEVTEVVTEEVPAAAPAPAPAPVPAQ